MAAPIIDEKFSVFSKCFLDSYHIDSSKQISPLAINKQEDFLHFTMSGQEIYSDESTLWGSADFNPRNLATASVRL